MMMTTAARINVPIQYTEAVTIIGECCRIRRFEIRIHAMAANIESTTRESPRMLVCAVPEAPVLDNAISAAPTVEAASASSRRGAIVPRKTTPLRWREAWEAYRP